MFWDHRDFLSQNDRNCNFVDLLHHPFWIVCVGTFEAPLFNYFYFVWLRINEEGSVPGMRIWSILMIKSDLKWCIIFFSRNLFLYVTTWKRFQFQFRTVYLIRIIEEKKKEIWPSPMTKPPIPTENSKTKVKHTNATQIFDYTTIADRLRAVSWSNKSSSWWG